ncbi:LIM zinc-binding domain-containing Nebulette [Plodia interpunctella]|uniref:LIM zinc-binding domain-containing Nebulette n=1 Tax=Plodia interpunctella TaxID=58824 RepID=UPI00236794B2|nr:LIM zinc-binding domain-containing Nebulette isoform X1 [Plodia interpunctella]
MNKTCARCEKTVYPTEELKCLDKVWHKGCFKCQECGMTLNMRTYKGYGKLPYCEAHVPKAKHTTMAETPELKRIAENTKIQSNVKYHADFEKSKGKFTQVADDPETLRIKANTKIISNVAYHGDLEKKAQMEKQRQINENGELVDVPTDYHQQIESYATEMLPPPAPPSLPHKNHYQTPAQAHQVQQHQNLPQNRVHNNQYNPRQYDQYKKYEEYNQNQQYQYDEYQNQYGYGYQNQNHNQPKIGRIQDYDPVSDGPRAPPNTQRSSQTLIYNSTSDGNRGPQTPQPSRQIGRVTDLDPLAAEQPPPAHHTHSSSAHAQKAVYVAMYDYEANDSDEVSFREGDYISDVTSVDSGWMTGRVLRTGHTGMLPANYVERLPSAHGY